MFGQLSLQEIDDLLKEQLVGRIGCHVEGVTYIVPMSYAYKDNYIYCHSFEGRKMEMMRKNPDICFEVDNTKDLANWQSVMAWGVFEELPQGPLRVEAIRILEERRLPILSSETMRLGSSWPFHSGEDNVGGIVFRIALKEKTGRYEKTSDEHFFAT